MCGVHGALPSSSSEDAADSPVRYPGAFQIGQGIIRVKRHLYEVFFDFSDLRGISLAPVSGRYDEKEDRSAFLALAEKPVVAVLLKGTKYFFLNPLVVLPT